MNLKNFAKEKKTFSRLTVKGWKNLSSEDLEEQAISINDFDIVQKGQEEPFAVVTLKEYPEAFYFAGTVLTEMLMDMVKEFGFKEVLEELKSNPLTIKLISKKSANKRTYYDFEVVE